ncbi:MAG TPA: NifU family protein [Anaerovoracaceae bacterium]|nr:NifU family protein [Anaerovoracaceae bacterium]
MKDKVQKLLDEKVNPLLAQHFGGATLTGIENNVAKVRFVGACGSCPSAQFTLEDTVKSILMEALPDLEDVVLDTSVSEDLIDMAKKILNKEL